MCNIVKKILHWVAVTLLIAIQLLILNHLILVMNLLVIVAMKCELEIEKEFS
jgi:hypothetical protein